MDKLTSNIMVGELARGREWWKPELFDLCRPDPRNTEEESLSGNMVTFGVMESASHSYH